MCIVGSYDPSNVQDTEDERQPLMYCGQQVFGAIPTCMRPRRKWNLRSRDLEQALVKICILHYVELGIIERDTETATDASEGRM